MDTCRLVKAHSCQFVFKSSPTSNSLTSHYSITSLPEKIRVSRTPENGRAGTAENPVATAAEAFANVRRRLTQLEAYIVSNQARSDELDRREKLLESKESDFRVKEAELEVIEAAIIEKLLDLENIDNLISEKREEYDLVRKRVEIRVRDLEETEAKAREAVEDWSRKAESKEKELFKKIRSKEDLMEVNLVELYRITKEVQECTNEAKRKEMEVELAKARVDERVREVERRERRVELESRRVEELRNNVGFKEKDLCAMEERLKEDKERDWGLFVKAAEERAKDLEGRESALKLETEEINKKKEGASTTGGSNRIEEVSVNGSAVWKFASA